MSIIIYYLLEKNFYGAVLNALPLKCGWLSEMLSLLIWKVPSKPENLTSNYSFTLCWQILFCDNMILGFFIGAWNRVVLKMNDTRPSVSIIDNGPRTPALPDYPVSSPEWVIDMNYLMPFSVMLMILCFLLLILCYLRHRMRQRRQLRQELRLRHLLAESNNRPCVDGKLLI